MNLIYRFRLTRILFMQVARRGASIPAVLENWDAADYAALCDYVHQCKNVVPKYVRKLSEMLGKTPQEVILEIKDAQVENHNTAGSDHYWDSAYLPYMPEDSADTALFVSAYCNNRRLPA